MTAITNRGPNGQRDGTRGCIWIKTASSPDQGSPPPGGLPIERANALTQSPRATPKNADAYRQTAGRTYCAISMPAKNVPERHKAWCRHRAPSIVQSPCRATLDERNVVMCVPRLLQNGKPDTTPGAGLFACKFGYLIRVDPVVWGRCRYEFPYWHDRYLLP